MQTDVTTLFLLLLVVSFVCFFYVVATQGEFYVLFALDAGSPSPEEEFAFCLRWFRFPLTVLFFILSVCFY